MSDSEGVRVGKNVLDLTTVPPTVVVGADSLASSRSGPATALGVPVPRQTSSSRRFEKWCRSAMTSRSFCRLQDETITKGVAMMSGTPSSNGGDRGGPDELRV